MTRLITRAMVIYAAAVAILAAVPLTWHDHTGSIDYDQLTEEWLKGVFELVKIGIVFLVGTVIWEQHQARMRRQTRDEANSRWSRIWIRERTSVIASCGRLRQAVEAQNREAFELEMAELRNRYYECDAFLRTLDAMRDGNFDPELLQETTRFRTSVFADVSTLVQDRFVGDLEWTISIEEFDKLYPGVRGE